MIAMNRDDYLTLLNRALASPYGIRLDYDDNRAARLVRGKLYRIREEVREEARAKPQHEPAVTYNTDGKFIGVLDILKHAPPPPTPYDCLRLRVYDGALYIVPAADRPRRVDQRPPPPERDIDSHELADLPPWPPWQR
jgi:hypothetical protein